MRAAGRQRAAVMVCALAIWACGSSPYATIDRLDVQANVLADGSIDVDEEMTARFTAPNATLERRIDGRWADAVTFTSATIDGAPLTPESADPSLDVEDGAALRVRMRTTVSRDEPRQVRLRYRLAGVVKLEGLRGLVSVPLLNAPRGSGVAQVRIEIMLPTGVQALEGSGMAEAGWDVERRPSGLVASRSRVEAAESATMMVRFEVVPGAIAEPAWQLNQERARGLVPAFLSGGLFILVIGAGVLWIIRFQYPKRLGDVVSPERQEVRRGLRLAGLALVAFSFAIAAVVWWLLSRLGPASMALPISIFLVGLIFAAVNRWWV